MADQQGVPIEKAAELLDRSPQTIVRWLKSGRLSGRKETVDGRERWLIDIPDNPPDSRSDPPPLDVLLASKDDRIADLQAEIQTLKGELAGKAKQIEDLNERLRESHILLQERKQLSEPGRKPWWAFWRRQ